MVAVWCGLLSACCWCSRLLSGCLDVASAIVIVIEITLLFGPRCVCVRAVVSTIIEAFAVAVVDVASAVDAAVAVAMLLPWI